MTRMNRWHDRGFTPPHGAGFTLTEILVAASLAVVVILAIGQVDVSRVRLSEELRRRANTRGEAALAQADMARSLQSADRIYVVSPTSVQFRRFIGGNPTAPGVLDDDANYQWAQYTLVDVDPVDGTMDTIRRYQGSSCGIVERFLVSSLNIAYVDVGTPSPPGGEPPDQDNNVLQFTIDGRYTTEVTIRNGAYTNLPTGLAPNDSGNFSRPSPPC